MDCHLPGSSVHGILQTRILKWVVISFSRDLPNPGIKPVSPEVAGRSYTTPPPGKPHNNNNKNTTLKKHDWILSLLALKWSESRSVVSDSLWPHGLYSPWNSPGQNTGVDSFLFSRGPSQPRDLTQVSHITGIFFTSWATREGPFVGWGREKKKTGYGSHAVTYTSKIEISFCRSWENGKEFWMSRAESSKKAPAFYTLEQQPLFPIWEACLGTLFWTQVPIQM